MFSFEPTEMQLQVKQLAKDNLEIVKNDLDRRIQLQVLHTSYKKIDVKEQM